MPSYLKRLWPIGLLFLCLLAFCLEGLEPNKVHFASDGPLGIMCAKQHDVFNALYGYWEDLYYTGFAGPNTAISISNLWYGLFGAVAFRKGYLLFAHLLLGLSGWYLARTLRVPEKRQWLVVLIFGLNPTFFSNSTWGLPTWTSAAALTTFAVALFLNLDKPAWKVGIAAGLCIGLTVNEAFDVGALLAIHLGLLGLLYPLVALGPNRPAILRGLTQTGLATMVASLVAAATVTTLLQTQVTEAAGATTTTAEQKRQKWNFATQWSLPKKELARFVSPNVFGQRVNSAPEALYWGETGRDANYSPEQPVGLSRHSGGVAYTGFLSILALLWLWSGQRKNPLSKPDAAILSLTTLTVLIGICFAFGRYAPFYQIIYSLPGMEAVRNPVKFLFPVTFALLVASTLAIKRFPETKEKLSFGFAAKATAILALLGVVYLFNTNAVRSYLVTEGIFPNVQAVIDYSQTDVLITLALTAGAAAILWCAQRNLATLPTAFLAIAVIWAIDLARANRGYALFIDYQEEYQNHPVFNYLHSQTNRPKVALATFNISDSQTQQTQQTLGTAYQTWNHGAFQYYNIASLEPSDRRTTPADIAKFFQAQSKAPMEIWRRMGCTHLLAMAPAVNVLNQNAHETNRYRIVLQFNLANDNRGWKSVPEPGPFAIIEDTQAEPFAKLIPTWERLPAAKQFAQLKPNLYLVDTEQTAPQPTTLATNRMLTQNVITPTKLAFTVTNQTPVFLRLNQKWDKAWRATDNDKPAPLCRIDAVASGVYLPPGNHTIRLRYLSAQGPTTLALAATALATLATFVLRQPLPTPPTPPETPPATHHTQPPAFHQRKQKHPHIAAAGSHPMATT